MNIGKTAFKGTFFIAFNTYANLVITFATGVILRKFFLPPEFFGIDALAKFYNELFGRLREFGFDLAVVHRQDNVDKTFATYFYLQVFIGLANFLLALVCYPLLSHFYPDQPLLPLITIIYVFFAFVRGLYLVQKTFLEKHLMFKLIALYDVLSLLIASLVALIAAYLGAGIWSLVLLNSSYFLINFLLVWFRGKWKAEFSFDKDIARWMFKYGFFLWIGAITTFVLYKYNDFVISSIVGLAALGYYATALSYAQMPTSLVTSIISRVALPTYAALQSEPEKLAFTFNFVLKNIVRFSLPLSLLLFLTADDFITLLLNKSWEPVIPIFKFLVIYSLFKPMFEDTGAFLAAIGRPRIVSFYITIQAILLLALSPIATYLFKVEGAALALGAMMIIGVALAYYYVSKIVKIHYWENFGVSFLIGALVIISYMLVNNLFLISFFPSSADTFTLFVKLMVKVILIVAFYLLYYVLFEFNSLKVDYRYLREILNKKS